MSQNDSKTKNSILIQYNVIAVVTLQCLYFITIMVLAINQNIIYAFLMEYILGTF